MSIPESEFPLYLRVPAKPYSGPHGPVDRTVETTATVLFDLDSHGRVIGVELLEEIPLTTETQWATDSVMEAGGKRKRLGAVRQFETELGARMNAKQYPTRVLLKRTIQVSEWVEVDEKETGNA